MKTEEMRFHEGQQLQAVGYDNCAAWYAVGRLNVREITVIMEAGAMANVPWALISMLDGSYRKVNLLECVEVRL